MIRTHDLLITKAERTVRRLIFQLFRTAFHSKVSASSAFALIFSLHSWAFCLLISNNFSSFSESGAFSLILRALLKILLTPFRNIMNEWYAKDISKKRKIVNKMKGNAGIPLSQPPYGYIKNPDDPRFWVIDPEAADVVRRICSTGAPR